MKSLKMIIGGVAVVGLLATAAAAFKPAPPPPLPPKPAVAVMSPQQAQECAMLKADIASEKDYFGKQKGRFAEMAARYSPQNRNIDLDQADRDFRDMANFVDRASDYRDMWLRSRGWCEPASDADSMVSGMDGILVGLRSSREKLRESLIDLHRLTFDQWAAQSGRR